MKSESSGYFSTLISLFASSSTLICCALPSLFVALGAGASLASILGTAPFLITISEHKEITFGGSALMLAIAGFFQYKARFAPCPVDPKLAALCSIQRKRSFRMYMFSLFVFSVGLYFAFIRQLIS